MSTLNRPADRLKAIPAGRLEPAPAGRVEPPAGRLQIARCFARATGQEDGG